jgi:hypothetical protein
MEFWHVPLPDDEIDAFAEVCCRERGALFRRCLASFCVFSLNISRFDLSSSQEFCNAGTQVSNSLRNQNSHGQGIAIINYPASMTINSTETLLNHLSKILGTIHFASHRALLRRTEASAHCSFSPSTFVHLRHPLATTTATRESGIHWLAFMLAFLFSCSLFIYSYSLPRPTQLAIPFVTSSHSPVI